MPSIDRQDISQGQIIAMHFGGGNVAEVPESPCRPLLLLCIRFITKSLGMKFSSFYNNRAASIFNLNIFHKFMF